MQYILRRFFQNTGWFGLCFFCAISILLFSVTPGSRCLAQETEQEKIKDMHAYAYCLYDADGNRVLYETNGNERLAMASTTKIMTLITLLEHADPDEIVTVSAKAAAQPDVQLNICTGEQYRLGDLLYSLMLESHNDVAVALAEHVGGSVEGFAELMNAKAAELGLYDSHFVTPNGLDAEGHYSTAVELARLSAYALKNEVFRKIIQTTSYQFNERTKGRSFTVTNKNRFLYMMNGAIGIKTGFTGKAGYCFVGALEQEEHLLISVVLACGWPPHKEYKWADTRKLMQYGLTNYRKESFWDRAEIYVNDDRLPVDAPKLPVLWDCLNASLPVMNGTGQCVRIALADKTDLEETRLLLAPWDKTRAEITLKDSVTAPVSAGETVGCVTLWVGDESYRKYNITTQENIPEQDFLFCLRRVLAGWSNL